jgi:protein translocase SecG subunit
MSAFLITVIVVCAIIITIIVIMQPSKDSGMAGLSSGGGVTDSVFGAGRNEFLTKATWWLMAIFLISSVALAKHQTRERIETDNRLKKKSVLEQDVSTSTKIDDASSNIITTTPEGAVDAVKDLLKKNDLEEKVEETEKKTDEIQEKLDGAVKDAVKSDK